MGIKKQHQNRFQSDINSQTKLMSTLHIQSILFAESRDSRPTRGAL